jgi:hypothetical protein
MIKKGATKGHHSHLLRPVFSARSAARPWFYLRSSVRRPGRYRRANISAANNPVDARSESEDGSAAAVTGVSRKLASLTKDEEIGVTVTSKAPRLKTTAGPPEKVGGLPVNVKASEIDSVIPSMVRSLVAVPVNVPPVPLPPLAPESKRPVWKTPEVKSRLEEIPSCVNWLPSAKLSENEVTL